MRFFTAFMTIMLLVLFVSCKKEKKNERHEQDRKEWAYNVLVDTINRGYDLVLAREVLSDYFDFDSIDVKYQDVYYDSLEITIAGYVEDKSRGNLYFRIAKTYNDSLVVVEDEVRVYNDADFEYLFIKNDSLYKYFNVNDYYTDNKNKTLENREVLSLLKQNRYHIWLGMTEEEYRSKKQYNDLIIRALLNTYPHVGNPVFDRGGKLYELCYTITDYERIEGTYSNNKPQESFADYMNTLDLSLGIRHTLKTNNRDHKHAEWRYGKIYVVLSSDLWYYPYRTLKLKLSLVSQI